MAGLDWEKHLTCSHGRCLEGWEQWSSLLKTNRCAAGTWPTQVLAVSNTAWGWATVTGDCHCLEPGQAFLALLAFLCHTRALLWCLAVASQLAVVTHLCRASAGAGQTIYFDSAYGMGYNNRPLVRGYDCPWDAHYMNSGVALRLYCTVVW